MTTIKKERKFKIPANLHIKLYNLPTEPMATTADEVVPGGKYDTTSNKKIYDIISLYFDD